MINPDMLKIVPWPGRTPIPGSFTSTDQVANRGVISAISENEPIVESKLAPVGAGAGLAPTIPQGMRAVSVRVNEIIGVAGFVIPGSRVDLVVTVDDPTSKTTITRAVLSNLEVLTAGTRFDQEQARAAGKPINATVVTFLATPQDAEKITLATAEGRTMLTLRNPLDVEPTVTQGARLTTLMGSPAPPPVERRVEGRRVVVAAPPPPAPKIYTVEAIRAAKRTEEPIR
jgi:pilus assembly protein CpaB